MKRHLYSPAMLRAFEAMDLRGMRVLIEAAKDGARRHLREEEAILTSRGFFIYDRWWRQYARKHPMGYFIHGSTFEEPRRGS